MTSDTEYAALIDLDSRIDALASDGDFESLAALLADDFCYVHSTGLVQTKAEWIEGLRGLVGRRRRLVSNPVAREHGDVAVVSGDLDVVWNDGRLAMDRYVRVYKGAGSGRRLVFQRTFTAPDRKQPGAG